MISRLADVLMWGLLLTLIGILSSCGQNQTTGTDQLSDSVSHTADIYTCPMHPEIIRNAPGQCPICGMDLVKKVKSADINDSSVIEMLSQPANRSVIANLKTTKPKLSQTGGSLYAKGIVAFDKRDANIISARVSGRIEKIYVRYEHQHVDKGEKLMELYSPELVSAQNDYLYLYKNKGNESDALVQQSRQKLIFLGMNSSQVSAIEQTGKALMSVTIYSPYTGVVHYNDQAQTGKKQAGAVKAGSSSEEMGGMTTGSSSEQTTSTTNAVLKEGMYISKGQAIFYIQSHNRTWALLSLYADDLGKVKLNTPVTLISQGDTTEKVSAKVDFIEPYYAAEDKIAKVRVYLEDNHRWKIGTLLNAVLSVHNQGKMTVPVTSVVDLGKRKIAWVKAGNATGGSSVFIAREVKVGTILNGEIEVLSGLNETDEVAIEGAYLVDSESLIL